MYQPEPVPTFLINKMKQLAAEWFYSNESYVRSHFILSRWELTTYQDYVDLVGDPILWTKLYSQRIDSQFSGRHTLNPGLLPNELTDDTQTEHYMYADIPDGQVGAYFYTIGDLIMRMIPRVRQQGDTERIHGIGHNVSETQQFRKDDNTVDSNGFDFPLDEPLNTDSIRNLND
jgi:hypothetical protein